MSGGDQRLRVALFFNFHVVLFQIVNLQALR
jgi:hypothetical protein